MSGRFPKGPLRHKRQDNLAFEIKFFEDLLREAPDYLDALTSLAEAYTRAGLHEKGLEADIRITRLSPSDPVAFYNLACSHCLLGQGPPALRALETALKLGYKDIGHILRDKDLKGLRRDRRFRELLLRYFPQRSDQATDMH